MKTRNSSRNSLIVSTPPICEGRVNGNKSLFATLNGGAHLRWVSSFLFIAVLVGALLSGAVLMAKPDRRAVSSPVPLSASLYTSADSMRHYQALLPSGDARAQYVMACSYYYASERPVPADVPYISDKAVSDSLLIESSIRGYQPAKDLIRCLQTGCKTK